MFCNYLFLKILSAFLNVVIAQDESPEWNFQWAKVNLDDGWNNNKGHISEWNYQNPTGWSEFDNNNAWEKTASISIKEWHHQVPTQQQDTINSNRWTTKCGTMKPRYLYTEVIYPNVITNNNNQWNSNNRKPSNNEW